MVFSIYDFIYDRASKGATLEEIKIMAITWANMCDGKPVEELRQQGFLIQDDWTTTESEYVSVSDQSIDYEEFSKN